MDLSSIPASKIKSSILRPRFNRSPWCPLAVWSLLLWWFPSEPKYWVTSLIQLTFGWVAASHSDRSLLQASSQREKHCSLCFLPFSLRRHWAQFIIYWTILWEAASLSSQTHPYLKSLFLPRDEINLRSEFITRQRRRWFTCHEKQERSFWAAKQFHTIILHVVAQTKAVFLLGNCEFNVGRFMKTLHVCDNRNIIFLHCNKPSLNKTTTYLFKDITWVYVQGNSLTGRWLHIVPNSNWNKANWAFMVPEQHNRSAGNKPVTCIQGTWRELSEFNV